MKRDRIGIVLVSVLLAAAVLYACAGTKSVAVRHPEKVKGLVNCAECHSDRWGAWNHKAADFYGKHRFYAGQNRQACYVCHEESFCADCHGRKEEMKPSDKFRLSPERSLPHRGDYLTRHKIEGRINPASCVRCHGRQNNERCKTCHR